MSRCRKNNVEGPAEGSVVGWATGGAAWIGLYLSADQQNNSSNHTLELRATRHFNSSRMLIQGERVVRILSCPGVKKYTYVEKSFVSPNYYDVREELCRGHN